MKKSVYEVLSASFLIGFCLVLFFAPIYFFGAGNYAYFPYCIQAGATLLSLGGGIFLFLFLLLGAGKIVLTFLMKGNDEKQEQFQFAIYSIWIILGLGYSMICFQSQSLIAFGLGIGLAFAGLLSFFLDYHLYGQD